MATSFDPLAIRRAMNRAGDRWLAPRPHGEDGWSFVTPDRRRSLIVSCAPALDDIEWVHASMTGDHSVPTYAELKLLHRAIFGNGWAYQVFAPAAEHVNIHGDALHLFGRLDGKPALPDFTFGTGSI